MTRHVRRASALILASALFAAGAWGQSTTIRQWAESIDVASEYFGTTEGRELGRDVKGETTAPKIILTIHDDAPAADGGGSIGAGNIARITYTLKGATFAETVSASNLTGDLGDGNTTAAIETEVVEGGSKGDSSVTIEVEVAGTVAITGDDAPDNNRMPSPTDTGVPKLVFEVPMLQATGAVLSSDPNTGAPTAVGVAITTSIAVRRARDNPFPGVIQGADVGGTPVTAGEAPISAASAKIDPVAVAQSQVYNTMMPGLNFAWETPFENMEEVDVMSRKVIIALGSMARDPSVKDPNTVAPALRIGTIDVSAPATTAADVPKDLGGEDPAVIVSDFDNATPPVETPRQSSDFEVGDGLNGDAVVTVAGPFQTGDKIYLGTKTMSIDGGVAMGTVDIETLLQSDGMDVIYVPGGVDDLKPSTFVGTAKLDFDDDENSANANAGPIARRGTSTGELGYKDFSDQGYAYGIVKGGGTDQSFVRVTCEASYPCVIFADCTGQDGMSYFGGPVSVGAGETGVVSSDDIAAAIGGGWDSGRGRCDMVANGKLSVQHMVRSGHTLVNNSVVVNRPVAAFPNIPDVATYDCALMDGPDDNDIIDQTDPRVCTPRPSQ